MKKIVRGNDFTLRVPVRKIVGGEVEKFPLPACEEVEVNLVNAFRRRRMAHTIGVEDDSLLEVRVKSSEMALGAYALEVRGKLFGCSWRSNEYEQIQLVDNNAQGDTVFEPQEGEDSVEMDTAVVVLPPTVELGNLITGANEAIEKANVATERANASADKADAAAAEAEQRTTAAITEVKGQTTTAIGEVKQQTTDAIAKNDKATADAVAKANTAADNAVKAKADADTATERANKAAERCEGISVEFDEERGSLVIRN
nr:MAG TPA: hypothetical protein [Caudoviricetes sp.]